MKDMDVGWKKLFIEMDRNGFEEIAKNISKKLKVFFALNFMVF